MAETALTILLGINVYQLTHNPLSLGWLGLAEAVPAISLVLIGGHVADRASRRALTIAARTAVGAIALVLAFAGQSEVAVLYAAGFALGAIRAFEEPAITGLEAEILPRDQLINAVSLIASVSRVSSLAGPVLGALLYDHAGPGLTYGVIAALLAGSAGTIALSIAGRPAPPASASNAITAIVEGLRYVFASQIIVGSMALDLFAVFFGGVTGMLPAFTEDVLHLGPSAVGFLRAAASAGGLAAMLIATRYPPRARAGLALHLAVGGFGLGIVVFAFSRSLVLCMAALAFAGACDGISVIIRRAIVRLAAPDGMRGRVAAVRGLFLNASNELGTFESGIAAAMLGIVPAVWLGGVVTVLVAGVTAWRAPQLRRLNLLTMQDSGPRPL